jgi:hypothetical protein
MKHLQLLALSSVTSLAFVFTDTSQAQTFTLNTFFGIARSADGVPVPDGAMWALIVDSNDDGVLPGGLQQNSSLVLPADGALISSQFGGSTLAKGGLIGGDTIFDVGGFNGFENFGVAGYSAAVTSGTHGTNGATTGRVFGFYWFPGLTSSGSNVLPTTNFSVGGVHDTSGAMTIPGLGATVSVTLETSVVGGSFPADRFNAVVVPEPSLLALFPLSFTVRLRRRRN